MIDMLKYWPKEFDLDGFHCDVAGDVPTAFWEAARAELESIKSDILKLAEASKPELLVKAFDVDYAWPFHATLTEVMVNGRPATAIRDVWKEERSQFPRGALHMRSSDNHDERRAIARFGERGALAASAPVFTMDGVPMLYNGIEMFVREKLQKAWHRSKGGFPWESGPSDRGEHLDGVAETAGQSGISGVKSGLSRRNATLPPCPRLTASTSHFPGVER
jgi:hypothetical protein